MNEKQKRELADKLKHILAGRKISQLAEESGVSRSYLSRYVSKSRDTAPTPEILKKIAEVNNEEGTYEDLMIKVGYWEEDSLKKIARKRKWLLDSNKSEESPEMYENFLKERFQHQEMVPVYNFEDELIWKGPNYKKKKFNFTSEKNVYFSSDLASEAKYAVEVNNNKMKNIGFISGDILLVKTIDDELPASGSTVLAIIKQENGIERTVKKYYRLDNGKVHLDPSDKSKSIYDESDIKIAGVVITMRRDLEV
jgi:SOS-response transcriptional repressor LexA